MYKERKKKNALQNRSGVEALNRNHRAYNIRPSSITTHDGYTCSAIARLSDSIVQTY